MEGFFAFIGGLIFIPGLVFLLLYLVGYKDSKQAKEEEYRRQQKLKDDFAKSQRENEQLKSEIEKLKQGTALLDDKDCLLAQLEFTKNELDSCRLELKHYKDQNINIERANEREKLLQLEIKKLEHQLSLATEDTKKASNRADMWESAYDDLQKRYDEEHHKLQTMMTSVDKRLLDMDILRADNERLVHENNVLSNLGFQPPRDSFGLPLLDSQNYERYMAQLGNERMHKAIYNDFLFDIRAEVISGGERYTTTLRSCTCKDHQVRKVACKHMIALAMRVNAFVPFENDINDKLITLSEESRKTKDIFNRTLKIKEMGDKVNKAIDDKKQTFPMLADILANFKEERRKVKIKDPVTKRELTALIKQTEKQNAMLKNQISVYEYMFPILNEFKNVPPQNLENAILDAGTTGFHYQWLSQDDFAALSSIEKRQRWIDRYLNDRSKNAWEAGIKYERYIGYLCEQEGYSVKYTGALLKLNDMGRDLIVSKGKTVYIIQCKRFSEKKEIHENHLFQLFGSVTHYSAENPNKKVYGVFVTSAAFSPVAAECAKKLDIKVYEHLPFKPYPIIKCNIGRSGDKIYHLPFDQQYDTVTIELSKGERYVETIEEAEAAGYRHAMRHSFE